MSLTLKLEATAGDSIAETAEEMCAVATRLGLWVDVRFNDVHLMAQPGGDPATLVAAYEREIKSKRPHKFAVARAV